MRRMILVALLVLAMLGAACGGGEPEAGTEDGSAAGDSTTSTSSQDGATAGATEFCAAFKASFQARLPEIRAALAQMQAATATGLDPQNIQATMDSFAAFARAFLPVFEEVRPVVPPDLAGSWGAFVDGFVRLSSGSVQETDPAVSQQFSDASAKVGAYIKTQCGVDVGAGLGGIAPGAPQTQPTVTGPP